MLVKDRLPGYSAPPLARGSRLTRLTILPYLFSCCRTRESDSSPPSRAGGYGTRSIHWCLRSQRLRDLIRITTEENAYLESAAGNPVSAGLAERASALRGLGIKLRALRRPLDEDEFDDDPKALMRAEGLAIRSGPPHPGRTRSAADAWRCHQGFPQSGIRLRSANHRTTQSPTGRTLRRAVRQPCLHGRTHRLERRATAKLRAACNSEQTFVRDPDIDLQLFAECSFGAYQEEPVDVVLRFDSGSAYDARTLFVCSIRARI